MIQMLALLLVMGKEILFLVNVNALMELMMMEKIIHALIVIIHGLNNNNNNYKYFNEIYSSHKDGDYDSCSGTLDT